MAETLETQNSNTMTASEYGKELESQRKKVSSQRFPARTLRAQQEQFRGISGGVVEMEKRKFVGKRKEALGDIRKEEKRVGGIVSEQLEGAGTIGEYEKYYEKQPENIRKYVVKPQKKRKELEAERKRIEAEIKKAEEQYEKYREREREADSDRAEDSAEERQVYYREYAKRLREGKSRIQEGQFLDYKQVRNYADEYADFERDKEEASNRERQAREKAQKEYEKARQKRITELAEYEARTGQRLDIDPDTLAAKTRTPTDELGQRMSIAPSLQKESVSKPKGSTLGLTPVTEVPEFFKGQKPLDIKRKGPESPTFGTRTDLSPVPKQTPDIIFGELRQEVTGKVPGTDVSTTQLKYYPTVEETARGERARRATAEEEQFFRERTSVLRTPEQTFGQKVSAKAFEAQEFIGIDVSKEARKKEFISEDWLRGGIEKAIPGESKFEKGASGFVAGVIPTTRGQFIGTAATFGAGAAVGAGIRGSSLLAQRIPRVGTTVSRGINLGAAGAGVFYTGKIAVGTAGAVSVAETPEQKGRIIGGTAREFATFGAGAAVGSRGADIFAGRLRTRVSTRTPERLKVDRKRTQKTPLSRTFAEDIVIFEKGSKIGTRFEPYKPTALDKVALERFKRSVRKPEPIEFELSSSLQNQINRLRSEADIFKVTPEGKIKLESTIEKPKKLSGGLPDLQKLSLERFRKKAESKPKAKPKPKEAPFEVKIDSSFFERAEKASQTQRQKGRQQQQQLLLEKPKQVQKEKVINLDKIQFLQQKQLQKLKIRQKQRQKLFQTTKQASVFGLSQFSGLLQKSKVDVALASRQRQESFQLFGTSQLQSQRQRQNFRQLQQPRTRLAQPQMQPQRVATKTIQLQTYDLIRKTPKKKKDKRKRKARRKSPFGFGDLLTPTGYTPSFTAAAFEIKGPKPKAGTIGIRPLIK